MEEVNMKKYILALTLLATCAGGIQAATDTNDTISVTKWTPPLTPAQRIADQLMLDDKTTAKFIPLYEAYQKELKEAGKKENKRIRPQQMTDAQINEQIKEDFEQQQKRLDIQKKYYKKFSNVLTPKQTYELLHRNKYERLYPFPGIPPKIRFYGSEWPNTPEAKKAQKSLKRMQKIMGSKEVQDSLQEAKEAGRIINKNIPRHFKYNSKDTNSEK